MIRTTLVAASALLLAACNASIEDEAGSATGLDIPDIASGEISEETMKTITERLSSDEFEGRMPGTAGEEKTVAYLIEQFERVGLEPGNNGSWTQKVPLVEITYTDGRVERRPGTSLHGLGEDVVVSRARENPVEDEIWKGGPQRVGDREGELLAVLVAQQQVPAVLLDTNETELLHVRPPRSAWVGPGRPRQPTRRADGTVPPRLCHDSGDRARRCCRCGVDPSAQLTTVRSRRF